jgi:hypothetical protein
MGPWGLFNNSAAGANNAGTAAGTSCEADKPADECKQREDDNMGGPLSW